MRGKLIVAEGPDGSGKSTNVSVLAEALRKTGREVVVTREPGGTPFAEKIRALVLAGDKDDPVDPQVETILMFAARAQHMNKVILPALLAGKFVISDRFIDSTYAYQGYGRSELTLVEELDELVLAGFEPDYTLFFDVTLEESERRIKARQGQAADRFDNEVSDFRKRVYEGYQARYRECGYRMHRINGMQPPGNVEAEVLKWVNETFFP